MNKMMLSIFKGYADTMPVAVSLDEVVRLIREYGAQNETYIED